MGIPGRHALLERVRIQGPQGRNPLSVEGARGRVGVCVVRVERRADRGDARAGLRHPERRRRSHPASSTAFHRLPNAVRATIRRARRFSGSTRCSYRPIAIRTHCTPMRSTPDMVTLKHACRREPRPPEAHGVRDGAAAHRRSHARGTHRARISLNQLWKLPQPRKLDRVARARPQVTAWRRHPNAHPLSRRPSAGRATGWCRRILTSRA